MLQSEAKNSNHWHSIKNVSWYLMEAEVSAIMQYLILSFCNKDINMITPLKRATWCTGKSTSWFWCRFLKFNSACLVIFSPQNHCYMFREIKGTALLSICIKCKCYSIGQTIMTVCQISQIILASKLRFQNCNLQHCESQRFYKPSPESQEAH